MPCGARAASPAFRSAWQPRLLHRLRAGGLAAAIDLLPPDLPRWSRTTPYWHGFLERPVHADDSLRVPTRFFKHLVAETRSITRQKRHEVERALLRLAQRIKRSAHRADLLHDVGVLFLRGSDEPSLETLQSPHEIRAQSLCHGGTHGTAFLLNRIAQLVQLFVEQNSRGVELLEDALRQLRPCNARLHLVRIAEIFGEEIELFENPLDMGLDYRARPPGNNRRCCDTERLCDWGDLREIGDLRGASDISRRGQDCALHDRAQQHVRTSIFGRRLLPCRLDWDALASTRSRAEDEGEAGHFLNLRSESCFLDLLIALRDFGGNVGRLLESTAQ